MAREMTQSPPRVVQVAKLIRGLRPEEREQLKMLVPELREAPPAEQALGIDLAELRTYIAEELARLGEEYPPLQEDEPFLGGLTVREYFALTDKERERIWEEAHSMEIEDFTERDVRPEADVSVR